MTQTYRLATSNVDYKKAHALLAERGLPKQTLNFPTILAENDEGELVGFLGTDTSQDMVVCGPMVLRGDRRRPFTLIGLIEKYDSVMREAGVSSYIFVVGHEEQKYLKQINEVGLVPYATEDGKDFFIRKI